MKNRIISLVLTVFLVSAVLFGTVSVTAASDAVLSVGAIKGSTEISSVSPGEKLTVSVSVQNSKAISSLQFKISYDPALFTFAENSVDCLISDVDGVAQSAGNTQTGTVTVIWDTTASNTVLNGKIFNLLFTAETVGSNANGTFKITSAAFYDSSNQKITSDISTASVNVAVNAITFTEEELEAYRKLETITYPDSKADIDAAKAIFTGYSNEKIKAFFNSYPDLYEYYRTASTRYYIAQENAGYAEIDKAIAAFQEKYARILAIPDGKVTLSDKTEVTAANDELGAMSDAVLARMDNSVKEKIKSLVSEIRQLEKDASKYSKAVQEYEEFKKNFKTVLEADENDIAGNYEEFGALVVEAIASFDLMSDIAQELGQSERAYLSELMGYVNKYTAEDEAEQALLEKQQEFLKKHATVLAITQRNVTVYDKTAIEIAIADIDAQPEALREKLAMRRSLLQKLLDKIATMEVPSSDSNGTATIITKPTNTTSSTTTTGGNSGTTANSAVKTETNGDSTNTVTKTVISEVPQIILILCIILAVSVLMLVFPAILAWQYLKQKKYMQIEGEVL
ncbi:MAG: hypothetical protein IIY18_02700 [Clostridia bacterium]|nr:hypothetical protein [Clostridia bacterium]